MAQLVKHLKQSIIADGPDPNQVNPSDWNASHVFSGGALGGLLVRDTGDATYGASWLASVAAGNVLISNGVGALPTWASSLTLGGSLTVNGILTVNNTATFQLATPNDMSMVVRNTQGGATARTTLLIGNDTLSYLTALVSNSSTMGTSSWPLSLPNGSELHAFGAGGLTLSCDTAAAMRFVTNNVERARVLPTGEVTINATATVGGAQFAVAADAALRNGIAIQNTNSGVTAMYFMLFYNAAAALAGAINQTGSSTVAYNTSSDARLKDDAGRATDVAALRAVVVHDFTWKADGVRARGVFAQEAYDVFPLAISKGTDERTAHGDLTHPWMTDYSKFVPDLIVGWQQHDAEIAENALRVARAYDDVTAEVAALRAELATLKG